MKFTLTGKEVMEIAQHMGFEVEAPSDQSGREDLMDYEVTIESCPEKGVLDDDGSILKSRLVISCDGCDPDECIPIGETKVIGNIHEHTTLLDKR